MSYTTSMVRKFFAVAYVALLACGLAEAQWNRTYHHSPNDFGFAVATDGSGSSYVAGRTETATGDDDIVTLKYDSSGTFMWSRIYLNPAGNQDRAYKILVDLSGNVLVGGLVSTGTGASARFGFALIKYDANGNVIWDRQYFDPTVWCEFSDMDLDASGNIVITGAFEKSGQFINFLTVKYDPSGNLQWSRQFNGKSQTAIPNAVSTDSLGNIVVVGRTVDSSNIGEITTVKYNSAGTLLWSRQLARNGNNEAISVGIDGSNNIYVGATLWTVVKYTPDGVRQWTKPFADPTKSDPRITAVKVDAAGNVSVSGTVVSAGSDKDWVTSRYDTNGNLQWNQYFDGTLHTEDVPMAITLNSVGNAIVTGYENHGSDITQVNIVTIKYNAAGTRVWTRRKGAGDGKEQISNAIAVDLSDNVFITGWIFQGTTRGYDIFTSKMPP